MDQENCLPVRNAEGDCLCRISHLPRPWGGRENGFAMWVEFDRTPARRFPQALAESPCHSWGPDPDLAEQAPSSESSVRGMLVLQAIGLLCCLLDCLIACFGWREQGSTISDLALSAHRALPLLVKRGGRWVLLTAACFLLAAAPLPHR